MIATPILDTPLDVNLLDNSEQDIFNRDLSRGVEAGNDLIKTAAEAKLQGIKDEFGKVIKNEELQFRQEFQAQIASSNTSDEDLLALPGVTQESLQGVKPEVRALMAQDAKDRRGVQQGFLDANDYQIRTEARMRQYLVRYPHLQDELLSVARNAGGYGLIPADLQAAFEDIKDIQTAEGKEDSEVKRLKQVSKDYKVDQTLYTTNPQEYWERTLAFSEANQTLAGADLKLEMRNKTGQLAKFDLVEAMNVSLPGMVANAWAADIQPAVLQTLNITNLNNFDPASYDPVQLDSIRQQLNMKKSAVLAQATAKYGRTGDLDAAAIKATVQPVLDLYDAAAERLGSKNFSADMQNHVSTLVNGQILTMPDGIALKVYSDMARGMDQSFASDLVKRAVSKRLSAAMVTLFSKGAAPGKPSNFDPNTGAPLPFAKTNPLIDAENDPTIPEAELQKGVVSFIRQVHTSLDQYAENKDPAYANVTRDASVSALRMLTDYYNDDAIKATKGAMATNISDEIISLGASENFGNAFAASSPELQQALTGTFRKTTATEFDQIMRGEVNIDLNKLLAPTQTMGDTPLVVPGSMPTFAELPTSEVITQLNQSQPIVMTMDPKKGQVYFTIDQTLIAGLNGSKAVTDADKQRLTLQLQNAANELTAKYSQRLTNLVRMTAHVTPGTKDSPSPYGQGFGVLAQTLLANGNINVGIDTEVITNAIR